MSMKTYVGILMDKTSNLEITLGKIDILMIILFVPTHKRSMSSHFIWIFKKYLQ